MPGDIEQGTYMFTCTETAFAAKIIIFDSKKSYDEYKKTGKDVVEGTDGKNTKKLSYSEFWVSDYDSFYLIVKPDTVVVVEDELKGSIAPVKMNWAK